MLRIPWTIALALILISPGFFWLSSECEAQNNPVPAEYDYYSLAVTSISTSAAEASKLPDIPDRARLLIYAAKILPTAEHAEAISLLDVALRELKQWGSDDKANWYQRHTATTMWNEALEVYAGLDREKATVLQKQFQLEAEASPSNTAATSVRRADWFAQFSNRRAIADQPAQIALSIVDTDPNKALALVFQSLQGGIVSRVLTDIVQKLSQNGNRALLNELEIGMGQVLASSVTLDWSSLSYATSIIMSDKDMPSAARNAFVSFFLGSLQGWSNIVSDQSGIGKIDPTYISIVFTNYSVLVRPIISQYAPTQLLMFDSLLNQVAPLVPEKTRSQLQAFQPEKFEEPRDRLNDILKDPNPERRDLRLVRLVSQLLRNESEDSQKRFDLASDAISGFADPDTKTAFTDLFMITRMNALVKQKDFIEAQRLISSISTDETRAWALLALAAAATKSDKVLGFELISNGLQALDKASPSPHKVELMLIATGMLAKSDLQRAFDTLTAASRYANSSASKVDPPTKPPVAFGLDAAIGEAHTKLGVFPESLGDVQIDPSVSTLGTNDWFRANQIADSIREPTLRLRLKLEFARAMIAEGPKSQKKDTKKKPVTNN